MLATQFLRNAHKSAKKAPKKPAGTSPVLLMLWSCVKVGVICGVVGVAGHLAIDEIEDLPEKNLKKKKR